MTEKDLALLRILDETKNITHAADKLYMTQSALSKRIKALEEELNVKLVIRSRQGIRFTPEGEIVLSHCGRAAKELDDLRRSLNISSGEVCGTLRAGISINYALYRLPNALASYHKKYPKVHLDIITGHSRDLYRKMLDGSLDIAILRGEYSWDAPQFLLSQESICLIYPKEFEGKPLSNYLYISHQSDPTQEALNARWLRENNLKSGAHRVQLDSVTACVEMIKRGIGWGLLPEIALDNFKGMIRPCTFENGEPYMRRTHIICQRDAMELPQVKMFMAEVKKNGH